MGNITGQNKFYETQVMKQENERRLPDVEKQQAYCPVEVKIEHEAPTSFLPPEASQRKPDKEQIPSRKRPYEENLGRWSFQHREDRRGHSPQPPAEEDEDSFDHTLMPSTHITATSTSTWPKTRVVVTCSQWRVLPTCGQEPVPAVGSEEAVCGLHHEDQGGNLHAAPAIHRARTACRPYRRSLDSCSRQRGQELFSYVGGGSGKKLTHSRFEDYGDRFAKSHVIDCFADLECGNDVGLSFT